MFFHILQLVIFFFPQITKLVEVKAPSSPDYRKFKIYLDELDTVLKLLLKVSGQLARAENAVMNLPEGSDNSDMVRSLINT